MSNRRTARLNEQLKREISEILRTEVRDPRIGSPIVSDVEVTPDLWLARVYVRPDPTLPEVEKGTPEGLVDSLEAAAPFIRGLLGKGLKVRRVPELRFLPDRTLEQARRIERILDDVRPKGEEDTSEGPADDPEEGS